MSFQSVANGRVYIVADATMEDMDELQSSMRSQDIDEVMAAVGNIDKALRLSLLGSLLCKSVRCDDGLVCVYGVAAIDIAGGIGMPWMLGTTLLDGKHKRAVLQIGRECLSTMSELFPERLENHVDVRNVKSIRWLRWLGFSFCDPEPFGVAGLPFCRFYMEGRSCATWH